MLTIIYLLFFDTDINFVALNNFQVQVWLMSPGGVLRISSDGDDQAIFGGLKFLIPGFFRVGKFGKYFFGWLDLSRVLFGYSKQSEDS